MMYLLPPFILHSPLYSQDNKSAYAKLLVKVRTIDIYFVKATHGVSVNFV